MPYIWYLSSLQTVVYYGLHCNMSDKPGIEPTTLHILYIVRCGKHTPVDRTVISAAIHKRHISGWMGFEPAALREFFILYSGKLFTMGLKSTSVYFHIVPKLITVQNWVQKPLSSVWI